LLFKILQRVIDNDEAEENALDHRPMTFGALTGVMMAKEKFERVNQTERVNFSIRNLVKLKQYTK